MGKKIKQVKTETQRKAEVDHILQQFNEFGIPMEHEGVQKFMKIAKDFETHGYTASGVVKLVGIQRDIVFVFSQQLHITSNITLRYNAFT
jgi:hypothetical protein